MATLKIFVAIILGAVQLRAETFKNQKETFTIELHNKNHVSADCLKKKDCSAIKVLSAKVIESPAQGGQLGHPASRYCKDAGGISLILRDEKQKSFDFCQFADHSLIDSWDLYYHHHPRKK